MHIKTTIHLKKKILERLNDAAERTGHSLSDLTVMLMERALPDSEKLEKSFCRVCYQARDPEAEWRSPHIRLRKDAYEYALDIRKLFKMSFSAIITLAIEKYLDKLVEDILCPDTADGEDNYTVKNYVLIKECLDGVLTWRICWGFPPNLIDILPPETD